MPLLNCQFESSRIRRCMGAGTSAGTEVFPHAKEVAQSTIYVRSSNPLCGTKKIVKSNTYVAPDSRTDLTVVTFVPRF